MTSERHWHRYAWSLYHRLGCSHVRRGLIVRELHTHYNEACANSTAPLYPAEVLGAPADLAALFNRSMRWGIWIRRLVLVGTVLAFWGGAVWHGFVLPAWIAHLNPGVPSTEFSDFAPARVVACATRYPFSAAAPLYSGALRDFGLTAREYLPCGDGVVQPSAERGTPEQALWSWHESPAIPSAVASAFSTRAETLLTQGHFRLVLVQCFKNALCNTPADFMIVSDQWTPLPSEATSAYGRSNLKVEIVTSSGEVISSQTAEMYKKASEYDELSVVAGMMMILSIWALAAVFLLIELGAGTLHYLALGWQRLRIS